VARTVSALAGEVKHANGEKKPAPLRPFSWIEWVSVALLIVLGILLTVGTLVWFGLSHKAGGGSFASKTVVTTGTGATQKVDETDYSDTIVIFALTLGATFVLAGTMYGRLRDITLGQLKIDLEDGQDGGGGGAGGAAGAGAGAAGAGGSTAAGNA
jgi:hypothetical protein